MQQHTQQLYPFHFLFALVIPALLWLSPFASISNAQSLHVCATVPELGSLVHEVGDDQVAVTIFAKGTEDPHFVEAKPSFIKALSQCDLYIQVGMDLEIGWAPVLLREARNSKVLAGAVGYLDASTAITPLGVPSGTVDRSMGDVHPFGNPHYLLDPINGLRVAVLIRERLSQLLPTHRAEFITRYEAFRQRLGTALVGETLAKKYDVEKLALLFSRNALTDFLQSQGEEDLLGGWLQKISQFVGSKIVTDHNIWPYFANRFGLTITDTLEPKPGIPPTTAHLGTVINHMKETGVKVVLASAYYDPRYANFVTENTGATVALMAHQAGARSGTDDYISMIDYNVQQVISALDKNP
ncbi:MAG: metal ABC transporter substrate-binding protein [Candidatus Binatia bacterium]